MHKHDNHNSTERHSSKRKRQISSSECEEADHQPHSRNHTDRTSSNSRKDREDRENPNKKHKSDHGSNSRYDNSKRKHYSGKEKTFGSSSSKKENSRSSTSGEKNRVKPVAAEKITHGIDSNPGASFAEALRICEPMVFRKRSSSSKIKASFLPNLLREMPQEPLQINLSCIVPEIMPQHRPVPLPSDAPKRMSAQEEALTQAISNKNRRTKVYSGNKMKSGEVPSLFNSCTKVIQNRIDAIKCTGGVPYIVLKTVLEKATPDQLLNLEHYNSYLIKDTDELWRLHCTQSFRTKKREEMETWREMYKRCLKEREAKLKFITANIKKSQDRALPVRTTKLAYIDSMAKPPTNIAKTQAKNGIINRTPLKTSTSLKLSALATAGEASKVSVPNPGKRPVDKSTVVALPLENRKKLHSWPRHCRCTKIDLKDRGLILV